MGETCSCQAAPKLIFACSGAADVGAIADRAARQLSKERVGNMFCLAGIGGRVPGIMASTESAAAILAIDGCSLECVKHSLEQAGFNEFKHLRLDQLGLIKGQSPATAEAIEKVAAQGRLALA